MPLCRGCSRVPRTLFRPLPPLPPLPPAHTLPSSTSLTSTAEDTTMASNTTKIATSSATPNMAKHSQQQHQNSNETNTARIPKLCSTNVRSQYTHSLLTVRSQYARCTLTAYSATHSVKCSQRTVLTVWHGPRCSLYGMAHGAH
eukprot:235986-Chlamydomonas_euryale.AAC.1